MDKNLGAELGAGFGNLRLLPIRDFMSIQSIVLISSKCGRDISTCTFSLGSHICSVHDLLIPPPSHHSSSSLLLRCSRGSAPQRACTQPLLIFLHLVSNGPTHPGEAAQDLPLPFSLALTASLCSLCYHLWPLLFLLSLHHDGEREKEKQLDSLEVDITKSQS